ncbi:MAG: NADH-quinone oxidoreductase subunit NuoF [Bacillota bacterium]
MLYRAHVLTCAGTNCVLKGAKGLARLLKEEIDAHGLADEIRVVETGCFGLCDQGPIMVIYPEGTMYCRVKTEDIREIVSSHLLKGRVIDRLLYHEAQQKPVQKYDQMNYFDKQVRVVLRNCGLIDPEAIEEYIARGGYEALGKAVTQMTPSQVIDEMKRSGLRGRGGAGFPTGLKWDFTAKAGGSEKYIICNADEGEPGTFKDRLILEGDPHGVLEGMAIAAFAAGASKGFVYIRGEYQLSIDRLQKAIDQAKEFGMLGDHIFGSDFSFDVEIRTGAGAYVCGEETALIESIEGNRGEPRYKPPYPANQGLWGKPTVVNNVETLANVAPIISRGSAWFRSIGTERSPGTKVFTLTGDVVNEGLIEVPMGITLREVIYDIGGGLPEGRAFKMAQTGGTSGGCLPKELLDLPMDIDSLVEHGSALGSGALLIMDDSHCIIDITKAFIKFFKHESCGQCTPCREGTMRVYQFVDRLSHGQATLEDLDNVLALARTMQAASLCALGQTVPVPLLTTLRYFNDEYQAHLKGSCPTGVCRLM